MTDRLIEQVCTWNYVRNNRQFDKILETAMLEEELGEFIDAFEKVDHADALADIIFVAIGSLYKLLGSSAKVKEVLDIVCKANAEKGTEKNASGKVTKPKDFEGPEKRIQMVIDRGGKIGW